jgi:hypothetical protein
MVAKFIYYMHFLTFNCHYRTLTADVNQLFFPSGEDSLV